MIKQSANITSTSAISSAPRGGARLLLGPWSVVASWLVLAVAAFHPPAGTGVPICVLRFSTSVECPGCGLSRSVSSGARGMLAESVALHPFGPAILFGALLIALISLLPHRARQRITKRVDDNSGLANCAYGLFAVGFIIYGLWRATGDILSLPFVPV